MFYFSIFGGASLRRRMLYGYYPGAGEIPQRFLCLNLKTQSGRPQKGTSGPARRRCFAKNQLPTVASAGWLFFHRTETHPHVERRARFCFGAIMPQNPVKINFFS
jgi:hypothetical protein